MTRVVDLTILRQRLSLQRCERLGVSAGHQDGQAEDALDRSNVTPPRHPDRPLRAYLTATGLEGHLFFRRCGRGQPATACGRPARRRSSGGGEPVSKKLRRSRVGRDGKLGALAPKLAALKPKRPKPARGDAFAAPLEKAAAKEPRTGEQPILKAQRAERRERLREPGASSP